MPTRGEAEATDAADAMPPPQGLKPENHRHSPTPQEPKQDPKPFTVYSRRRRRSQPQSPFRVAVACNLRHHPSIDLSGRLRTSTSMATRPSKRHAGASSSSAPKDDVKFLSKSLKKKFTANMNKDYLGTRWYDERTMVGLGLHQEIHRLCGRIGASSLLELDEPTYVALTTEFLTSYKLTIHDEQHLTGTLQFQLGNEDRSLSLVQLNQIFGFPAGQGEDDVGDDELNRFWFDISGLDPPFVGALSNMIVHPVFRVIQRLLGNTIYARKECSKVLEGEPLVLFCMVHQRHIDLGYQLAVKFARAKTASVVCIGGLITVIAKHFGIALDRYSVIPRRLIDLNHLKSIGMVKDDRKQGILLRIFQTNSYRDFAPQRISTERKDSWYRKWVKRQLPERSDMMEESEGDAEAQGEDGEEEEEGGREGGNEDVGGSSQCLAYLTAHFTDLQQQISALARQVSTMAQTQEQMRRRQEQRYIDEDRRRDEQQQFWERQFELLRNLNAQFPPPQ